MRLFSTFLALAFAMALTTPSAQASLISSYLGATGSGLGTVAFGGYTNTSPSNDDVAGASANTITITEKRFDAFGAIWLEFEVLDDGALTTEFQVTETVLNNTGLDWIGYQVMVGFGTEAGWVHSPLGDELDFDFPDDNSPRDFAALVSLVYGENTIDAVGGIIPAGTSATFTYAIDVPNTVSSFSIRTSPRDLPVSTSATAWGRVKAMYQR